MTAEADPQARQTLFSTILSDVGLPQLHECDRVTVTRLVDQGTTTALLLESPEPISFVHDVTAALSHRARRPPPPRPTPALRAVSPSPRRSRRRFSPALRR